MARTKTQDSSTTTELDPSSDATTAPTNGTGTVNGLTHAEYEISGKDIPEAIRGRKIPFVVATSLESFANLVADGKPEHIHSLAQAQLNVLRQRVIRNEAEGEDVAAVLAGKGDAEGLTQDERIDRALEMCRTAGEEYVYGSTRTRSAGSSSAKKELDAAKERAKAKAAADPALAAQLREIFGADFIV